MNTDFDIVIVGGGVIGCSLAYALKDFPLRIAIIERVSPEVYLTDNSDDRTLALSHSSQRIYNTLGLWSQLKSEAIPIKQIHISAQGHFGATRLNTQVYDEGLEHVAFMVEIKRLMCLLMQSCRSSSAIKWFAPAQLQQISSMQDQQKLTVTTQQQTRVITTKLIIAADGSNSIVRRLLNIKMTEKPYGQTAIVANIGLARDHQHIAYERFTSNGAIAMLPTVGKQSAMVWAVSDGIAKTLLNLSDKDFLACLQKNFGYRLGRLVKVVKRSGFPLKLVQTKQKHPNGVIFIGNAAQALHPIAAQGFNLGLRDVAAIAQIVREFLIEGEKLGNCAMIKQYHRQRKWDKQSMIMLTDLLVSMFSYPSIPSTVFRSSLLVAIDRVKPVKKALLYHMMGMSTGMMGKLPDLVCGLPLNAAHGH